MVQRDNLGRAQVSPDDALGSALPDEVARFDALAAEWWDPAGPMRALHAMNPLRIGWIEARLPGPVRLLDVGCGGGLAAEALARNGHQVLGIDAAGQVIAAARAHAAGQNLPLDYRQATTADLLQAGERFAAITALEVIEHVADPAAFLQELAALLEPGGQLFISTLNRTMRSLVVARLGAEYLLRMLPIGTHSWRRFVTPAELGRYGREAGLRLADTAGMSFDPMRRRWAATSDLAINYLAELRK